MSSSRRWGALLCLAVTACHHQPRPVVFGAIDAERRSLDAETLAQRAPATWSQADRLRQAAEAAYARGDATSTELLGERAVATYVLSRATTRHTQALLQSDKVTARRTELDERLLTDRAALEELEADILRMEAEIAVRLEALEPATSSPAAGPREAARWTVVRSNLAAAAILCDAARLADPESPGLAEASALLDEVGVIPKTRAAPIDASHRVRALCLATLTKARNFAAKTGGVRGEQLREELVSAAFDPQRDERGLVLTWPQSEPERAPFEGARLSSRGRRQLEDVARIVDKYPGFRLLLVVHAAGAGDDQRDRARAQAATEAASAILGTRAAASVAGARLPAYDSRDVHLRAANERLEVIMVGD